MKIAIVTSCMAGVAQSHLAALALRKEAEKRGISTVIEEQGGHKVTNRLKIQDIETADLIILAMAINISEKNRFDGKLTLMLPVNKALLDPRGTMDRAEKLWLESLRPADSREDRNEPSLA